MTQSPDPTLGSAPRTPERRGKWPVRILLRVVLPYGVFGMAWILASDALLMSSVEDPIQARELAMAKGLAFVGLSTIALLLLVRVYERRQELVARRSEQRLRNALQLAQEARAAAEAANQTKDRFLAMLSHELRTPLTPAMAMVCAMEADPQTSGPVREDLGQIRRSLELEARLIDDLLDTVRLGHGRFRMEQADVDVHAVLEQAIRTAGEAMERKGLRLCVELKSPGHHVRGDAVRLQQAFWNILRNAARYVPAGGQVVVRTESSRPGMIAVTFTDNGVGIAPEDLQRIFEPFEQASAKVDGAQRGLGLGLAICKMIITAHGGLIRASSEGVGRGACFTIELQTVSTPAMAEAASKVELREAAIVCPVAAEPEQRRGLRVLLVEDDAMTLNIFRRLLVRMGHQVTTADCVAAAVAEGTQGEFDLLISDIGLPDGLGHEVMRQLAGRDVVGIAVSGFGAESDIQASRKAGFRLHLTKPIRVDTLQGAIAEVMGTRVEMQNAK